MITTRRDYGEVWACMERARQARKSLAQRFSAGYVATTNKKCRRHDRRNLRLQLKREGRLQGRLETSASAGTNRKQNLFYPILCVKFNE